MSLDDLYQSFPIDERDAIAVEADNSPDYEDEPARKKGKKEEIHWNEPKEYVLVVTYRANNAYMKSAGGKKGMSMENKKIIAFNQIKSHATFASVSHLLTQSGVDAKFKRLKKAVIGKYAMDGEGANLSGLPPNAPRVEQALYRMVEEEFKSIVRKGKKQTKETDRQNRVQEIQDRMLASMVRSNEGCNNPTLVPAPPAAPAPAPAPTLAPAPAPAPPAVEDEPASQDSTGTSSLSSDSTTRESREQSLWQRFLERREARRAEEKEGAASLSRALVAMEERRLQLEEQKLQLEARRLEVDAKKAENERNMFTFLLQQKNFANN